MSNQYINLKVAKKKFFVANIISFIVIFILSILYLFMNRDIVNDYRLHQRFNSRVKNQIFLLSDISFLSKKLATNPTVDDEVKFRILLEDLKANNTKFNKLLEDEDEEDILFILNFLSKENIQTKMKKYILVASELINTNQGDNTLSKDRIDYLLRSSNEGLGELLEDISKSVSIKNKDSLKKLELLGTILAVFCILQSLLTWAFIYRPLFKFLVRQQEKLSDAMVQAVSASKSKTNFLANISHEIRTPMTIILGYIDRLKIKSLEDEERDEAVNLVSKNAHHLLSLIDEVLDISKIEAGKITYSKSKLEMSPFLSDIYSLLNVKATEKNIDLIFSNTGEIPKFINTDEKRLKQILFNIIGNAIKFTATGHVELNISYVKRSKSFRFDIIDTGIGIDESKKKQLFKPFQQADGEVNRIYGGTGLGLVISRSLARGLGGNLEIHKSKLGMGTTFRLTLLSAYSEEYLNAISTSVENSRSVENKKYSLEGSNILVVDDSKENSRLFEIYLKSSGANVKVALGGQEAIDLSRDEEFDLILLDLQMPTIDGYQALKKIRDLRPSIKVAALTAHAMDEERKKTKEAGFNFHITKPISPIDLIENVYNLIHNG